MMICKYVLPFPWPDIYLKTGKAANFKLEAFLVLCMLKCLFNGSQIPIKTYELTIIVRYR